MVGLALGRHPRLSSNPDPVGTGALVIRPQSPVAVWKLSKPPGRRPGRGGPLPRHKKHQSHHFFSLKPASFERPQKSLFLSLQMPSEASEAVSAVKFVPSLVVGLGSFCCCCGCFVCVLVVFDACLCDERFPP
jgi:hypothetical protein